MLMIINKPLFSVGTLIIVLTFMGAAFTQANAQEDLEFLYGDEDFVSIATGRKQPISRAPAVATVITREDIDAIGARDLNEVLESVPGLHVSVSAVSYNPIYTIRGIYSEYNPQILVLINSIPITNLQVGDRGQFWGGMPVNSIERIEILRGPGSALYGADAFSGIVNIITKSGSSNDGAALGTRFGSFDTRDGWFMTEVGTDNWDMFFSMQYHSTDGQRRIIDIDAQSAFDALLGTSASLAPSHVNTHAELADINFDFSTPSWKVRLGYQARDELGTGAGVAQALDHTGKGESSRLNLDITNETVFKDHWNITNQLSYFDTEVRSELYLFPRGVDFSALGGGLFSAGVFGAPEIYEKHIRFSTSAFYSGIENHEFRVGVGLNKGDMYKIKERKNYDLSSSGIPIPLDDIVDVSDVAPFIREEDREIFYMFAQDEWAFSSDWKLTYGVRFDDYSDFGNTTNPRLALVWQAAYNLTAKFLYGRAFRAPSFIEQFNINNPVALGNDQLKPEEIDTIEVAFDYAPRTDVRTSLNIFAYEMRDIIRFTPDVAPATSSTAQNTGEQGGYGLEWEIKWSLTDNLRLLANYAFQKSTDEETDADAPYAPQQQFYTRLDWKITPHWRSHLQANRVMDRKREMGDLRPPIEDYTTFDWVLRYDSMNGGFGYSISARNLFDEDVREPSLAPGLIANDLPMPGRSFYGELSYRWH